MVRARLAWVLVAGLATSMAVAQSTADLLRKALEARNTTMVSLIQSHPMGDSEERVVTKTEYDGEGRMRRALLQPMRMQGQTTVDDGRTMLITSLDSKQQQLMPSLTSRLTPVSVRMDLIARNYRLTRDEGERIAGRSTIVITCRPVNRGLPTRRISIDEKTFLPLRSVLSLNGKNTVLLDTLSFEIPRSMPSDLFSTRPDASFRVSRVSLPARVRSLADVADKVPFRPWAPSVMPAGFAMDAIEVMQDGRDSWLALRLTDGFNNLTLYQWDAGASIRALRGIKPEDIFEARGTGMTLIGDVPVEFRRRLVDFLLRSAKGS